METQQMLDLMSALDKGTNMFGTLSPEVRARLFAVVSDPTQETWSDAYGILIRDDRLTTLWQALIRHADYPVNVGPTAGQPWPLLPTADQLMTAILAVLR